MFDFLNKYDASTTVGQLLIGDFIDIVFITALLSIVMVLVMQLIFTSIFSFTLNQFSKLRESFRRNRLQLEDEGYPTIFLSIGYFGVCLFVMVFLFTVWFMV